MNREVISIVVIPPYLTLDSYSACLIPVCLYSVFGRGEQYSVEPMRFYYVELVILFNFHVSHWEKYNTGVLYLPWGYDLGKYIKFSC